MADPLFQKARRFTDVETATLKSWIQALVAGLNAEAEAVNDAGLYLEHTLSLLAPDPEDWTSEQTAEINRASAVFKDAREAVDAAIAAQDAGAVGDPLQGKRPGIPPSRGYSGEG